MLALPFFILRSSLDYAKAGFNDVKRRASELAWGTNSTLHVQFRDRPLRAALSPRTAPRPC